MKKIIYFTFLVLLFSCGKEKMQVKNEAEIVLPEPYLPDVSKIKNDFFPLAIGYEWTYRRYQSYGSVQTVDTIVVRVVKDTLIKDTKYFKRITYKKSKAISYDLVKVTVDKVIYYQTFKDSCTVNPQSYRVEFDNSFAVNQYWYSDTTRFKPCSNAPFKGYIKRYGFYEKNKTNQQGYEVHSVREWGATFDSNIKIDYVPSIEKTFAKGIGKIRDYGVGLGFNSSGTEYTLISYKLD